MFLGQCFPLFIEVPNWSDILFLPDQLIEVITEYNKLIITHSYRTFQNITRQKILQPYGSTQKASPDSLIIKYKWRSEPLIPFARPFILPVMVFGEGLPAPGFFAGPVTGCIRPEGVCGGKAQGHQGKGGHVQAAVVGVKICYVCLAAGKTDCQETLAVKVAAVVKHPFHHGGEGRPCLAITDAFG